MIGALYFISVLFAFLYIFILTHILTAWQEIQEWKASADFKPDTTITVIVPFRNEKDNIEKCLDSIAKSNYPKKLFKIIAVDDHSDDGSASKVLDTVQLLRAKGEGKKNAISEAIAIAESQLIVTTDADCVVERDWLRTIASYYEFTKKPMIVGMVTLEGKKNVLDYFQMMETCGLMGLHAAGIHNKTHFLANGANLAFERSLFMKEMPYADNTHLSSGDDIFFINKVGETNPDNIGFLKSKDAIVTSVTERTWSQFWSQRKRWATKNNRFSKGIYKWMTTVIWILSLTILLNLMLIPFTEALSLFVAITLLFIKGVMDFLYLQNMTTYFDQQKTLKFFIPALLVQTFYIVIAGIFALIGGQYKWKGRTTR